MLRELATYWFLFSGKEIKLQKSKVNCPNLQNFPEAKKKWHMSFILRKMTVKCIHHLSLAFLYMIILEGSSLVWVAEQQLLNSYSVSYIT